MAPREPTPVPTLHRRHVPRPRLTQLLEASTAQAIILTAPPGYGKTSLAAEWLAGRPAVAWLKATSAEADLAAFSVEVADAVAPILPGAGERVRQRLRIAEAPEKAVRPLAELMAEDLADWPEGAWLVVDDYHHVLDSAPVEEFVDWLLTLAPVRALVTTRRRPGWATARRVLYGEVVEISKEQLAMTAEEAALLLDGRPTEEVRALVAQAHGWPALIGLAALATTSEIPSERLSEGLFRYFAEEVFRQEPPDIQNFMLVASIPQRISAATARDVLELPDPKPKLARLRDEGLLQEDDPGEFSFHPLLREFLQRRLEAENPDTARFLRSQALVDACDRQLWDEAFGHALRLGNQNETLRILVAAADDLLRSGRVETVEKWLTACGPTTIVHPEALLLRAEILIRQGRQIEAFGIAQDLCARLPREHPAHSRSFCLSGRAARLLSQDEVALDYFNLAREAAKSSHDLAEALWGAFLCAVDLERDEIESYLDELEATSGDDADSRLRLATGRTISARVRGSLLGSLPLLESSLHLVEFSTNPLTRSAFLAYLSYVNCLDSRYDHARDLAHRAFATCAEVRLGFNAALCDLIRIHAEIGLRNIPEVRRALRIARGLTKQFEDPFYDASLVALSLRQAILDGVSFGEVQSAENRIPSHAPRAIQGECHALLALHAAAAGKISEAQRLVTRSRQLTSVVEVDYLLRFSELIAKAHGVDDRHVDPAALGATLLDASTAGVLDAFVSSYRVCPRLLRLVRRYAPELTPLMVRTLTLANDRALALAAGLELEPPETIAGARELTRREWEVLQLLAGGLSNDEIAQRLVIAPSTAKVHVRNVLRKLGVRNRLAAALRARDLLEFTQEGASRSAGSDLNT